MGQFSNNLRLVIKQLLKKQGHQYKELAVELNISESSVKRLMTNSELTMNHVEKIANWLGYTVAELTTMAQLQDQNEVGYTYDELQDRILAENPILIYLMIRLLIGENIHEFSRANRIELSTCRKYLFQLEKLGMLQVHEEDRVRLNFKGPFRFKDGGRCANKFLPKLAEVIINYFLVDLKINSNRSNPKLESYICRPYEFYLTQASLNEFLTDLHKVMTSYRLRSSQEMSFSDVKNLLPVSGLILAGKFNAWKATLSLDSEPSNKL